MGLNLAIVVFVAINRQPRRQWHHRIFARPAIVYSDRIFCYFGWPRRALV
jgi:hypothetical protein